MGQSIIEINGTKYDATTGRIVTAVDSRAPSRPAGSGQNIDGIVINPTGAVSALKPTPKLTAIKPKSKEELSKQRRVHDISMVHTKRVNHSKTLMRSVVKKPGHVVNTNKPDIHQTSSLLRSPSYSAASSADARLNKALHTPTNTQVTRFTHMDSVQTKVNPTLIRHMPVKQPVAKIAIVSAPIDQIAHTPHGGSPASKFVDSQLSKVASQESESPFKKKGIHKRISSAIKANRTKSMVASTLSILLIGGFIAYQNLPTITLALANRDAGMSAKLPKNVPSNFALSRDILRSQGEVTLNYKSRVDDRNFTLSQVKGDMTSDSLKESIARNSKDQFQTYESGGITLYLSGSERADWVDGGVRYNISGKTGFTPDQLAQIASSL